MQEGCVMKGLLENAILISWSLFFLVPTSLSALESTRVAEPLRLYIGVDGSVRSDNKPIPAATLNHYVQDRCRESVPPWYEVLLADPLPCSQVESLLHSIVEGQNHVRPETPNDLVSFRLSLPWSGIDEAVSLGIPAGSMERFRVSRKKVLDLRISGDGSFSIEGNSTGDSELFDHLLSAIELEPELLVRIVPEESAPVSSLITALWVCEDVGALKVSLWGRIALPIIEDSGLIEIAGSFVQNTLGGVPSRYMSFDEPPRPIYMARPRFPDSPHSEADDVLVQVLIYIDPEGTVTSVESLSPMAPSSFVREALLAAKRCTFKPGKSEGHPTWSTMTVPFRFHRAE